MLLSSRYRYINAMECLYNCSRLLRITVSCTLIETATVPGFIKIWDIAENVMRRANMWIG